MNCELLELLSRTTLNTGMIILIKEKVSFTKKLHRLPALDILPHLNFSFFKIFRSSICNPIWNVNMTLKSNISLSFLDVLVILRLRVIEKLPSASTNPTNHSNLSKQNDSPFLSNNTKSSSFFMILPRLSKL